MLRFVRLLFWTAALFAAVMASLPQPPQLPGHPPDKLQHILAFATLTVLGAAAYPRISALWLAVGLGLFGGVIELIQFIPALNRDSEMLDWVADMGAVALVLLLIHAWRSWRLKRLHSRQSG